MFILYTHPFPCSGKHTHLEESCLFLSPHSVYIIKSVNLTQRLLTVSWHSTVQLCYNSVNQLLPFTWRAGCTQFFFLILAICCKHSCACVLTLLLTSALYTVSRGHTPEVGHTGGAPHPDLRVAHLSGAQHSLSQGALGATCLLPVPRSLRSLLFFLLLRKGSFYNRNTNLLSYIVSVFSPSPPVHVFAFCHQLKKQTKKKTWCNQVTMEGSKFFYFS